MKAEGLFVIRLEARGARVWKGQDLGPSGGVLRPGSREYEFWRVVPAASVPELLAALGGSVEDDLIALMRDRFRSDVELAAFASEHGIETVFRSWISTNWDD